MPDMNKLKSHPGFIAFKGSNAKPDTTTPNQLDEVKEDKQEIKNDQKVSGGGKGKG